MKNLSLKELQNLFQTYLIEGSEAIAAHIETSPSDKVSLQERLDIYGYAYHARLIEILGMDYPVLKKILGAGRFEKMGRLYVKAYPSQSFSIRVFGKHLPEFLAKQKMAIPAHAEMAKLELALSQAIDAADGPFLTFADLAQIPAESWVNMRLTLHPSVELIACFYNVQAVWRAVQQNKKKPRWHYQQQPQYCLIWRNQQQTQFVELTQPEHTFFHSIQSGLTFVEICESLTKHFTEEEIPVFASATLQKWVNQGLLSKTHFDNIQTTRPQSINVSE